MIDFSNNITLFRSKIKHYLEKGEKKDYIILIAFVPKYMVVWRKKENSVRIPADAGEKR